MDSAEEVLAEGVSAVAAGASDQKYLNQEIAKMSSMSSKGYILSPADLIKGLIFGIIIGAILMYLLMIGVIPSPLAPAAAAAP